jgi:hypothetical protein
MNFFAVSLYSFHPALHILTVYRDVTHSFLNVAYVCIFSKLLIIIYRDLFIFALFFLVHIFAPNLEHPGSN